MAVLFLVLCLTGGTALAETVYVKRGTVEIKTGKGAFYQTVYTARQGEGLELKGQSGNWYHVNTPNGPGWVLATALEKKAPPKSQGQLTGSISSSGLSVVGGAKMGKAPIPKAKTDQAVRQPAGKSIFEKRCSACHSLNRPLNRTMTPGAWRNVVHRMKVKADGAISDEEAKAIAQYLSTIRGR
jgi:mono/diheme cytochrome c family protein